MGHIIKLIPVMVILFSSVTQADIEKLKQESPSRIYGKTLILTDRLTPSLKGLKGVYVLTEDVNPDLIKYGLHRGSIQTEVETKLRRAGIKVLSKEECLEDPGMPYLCIRTNSKKYASSGYYVFSVRVELVQKVILNRDKNISCSAVTWYSSLFTGMIIAENAHQIKDTVKEGADKFIDDYLSVNPKE